MHDIKYIECTDEELSSIVETKEEMMDSIKAALDSPLLSQEIKNYIEKNYKSNPNPNNKEYTKFVLGLLNSKNEDFKIILRIIIIFTSEDNITTLMKKKLIRNDFKKGELETLASKIQFGLDCYDNKEKYFNDYIKSMIEFIKNVLNEKLFPFIINKAGVEKELFDDFTIDKYENKENKMKMKALKKKMKLNLIMIV